MSATQSVRVHPLKNIDIPVHAQTVLVPRVLDTDRGLSLLWIAQGSSALAWIAHAPRREYGWQWTDDQRKGVLIEVRLHSQPPASTPLPSSSSSSVWYLADFYNYTTTDKRLRAATTEAERTGLKGLASETLCWILRSLLGQSRTDFTRQTDIVLGAGSHDVAGQAALVRYYEKFGFAVYARKQEENVDFMVGRVATLLERCDRLGLQRLAGSSRRPKHIGQRWGRRRTRKGGFQHTQKPWGSSTYAIQVSVVPKTSRHAQYGNGSRFAYRLVESQSLRTIPEGSDRLLIPSNKRTILNFPHVNAAKEHPIILTTWAGGGPDSRGHILASMDPTTLTMVIDPQLIQSNSVPLYLECARHRWMGIRLQLQSDGN